MICPRLSDPVIAAEFNELKEAVGEDAAYAVWNLNGGFPLDKTPTGAPSLLFDDALAMFGGDRVLAMQLKVKAFYPAFIKSFNWIKKGTEPLITSLSSSSSDQASNKIEASREASTLRLSAVTAEIEDFRLSADGKYYEGVSGIFARLTEFVKDKFDKAFDFNAEEHEAKKTFENQGKDMATDSIVGEDNETYTYAEYLVYLTKRNNTNYRGYGTYLHALIQNYLNPHPDVEQKLEEMRNGSAEMFPIPAAAYHWLNPARIKRVFDELKFNFFDDRIPPEDRDEVATEVPLFSKLLKIGTAQDLIVKHNDGSVTFLDWKTGAGFFDEKFVDAFLAYGHRDASYNSKQNRAKLELMLRAVIYKESYGPSVKFRDITVAHLTRFRTKALKVDTRIYLKMIEDFYADEKNGQRHVYDELKAKGLFDPSNYIADNRMLDLDYQGLEGQDRMDALYADLESVNNQIASKDANEDEVFFLRKRHKHLSQQIAEQEKDAGIDLGSADAKPIGWFKRYFGSQYSISNPILQTWFKVFNRKQAAARARIDEYYREHDKLAQAIKTEYYERNPFSKTKAIAGMSNIQYKDAFNFMWVPAANGNGVVGHVITDAQVTAGTYSQAQKDYNNYVMKAQKNLYAEVMGKRGMLEGRRIITKANLQGLPDTVDDTFMPRTFMDLEDVMEANGTFSAKTAKHLWQKQKFLFLEDLSTPDDYKYGIPLKAGGIRAEDTIIGTRNHSMNVEQGFKEFVTNLVMKDELDDTFHLGKGLYHVLKNDENHKDTAAFLEDHIWLHVLDAKKPFNPSARGFHVTVGDKLYKVSVSSFMRGLKSWVSASAMWLKPFQGIKNAVLITIMNIKAATKGSVAKLAGVDDADIDFTLSDLIWAQKQYLKTVVDFWRGKPNKLAAFMKEHRYMPDNYDYKTNKSNLVITKNKLLDQSNLYIFQQIGEEYGAFTVLAAQLRHKKMGAKSAYDSYDLVDGKLVYNGEDRGHIRRGDKEEELKGLTVDEVTRMKRQYSRIHGGYRREERTAAELYAVGQWALQFKKYLPTTLEDMLQGSYVDPSLGKWKEVATAADGKPIYEWVGQVNQGRYRVLWNALKHYTRLQRNDHYSWEKLGEEQKNQLIDYMTTLTLYGLMVAGYSAYYDDDEEENRDPYRIQLRRLIDDSSQSIAIWDVLNSIKDQTVVLPRLHKMAGASYDYIWSGMVFGERTARGEMRNEKAFYGGIPFQSSWLDYNKYMFDDETAVTNTLR